MDWSTEHKLHKLAKRADPDRFFVTRLEKRLKAESGTSWIWLPLWKWASVPVLVVFLAGGTTCAYAYTSEDVLPDHALYPIKRGIEKVEETAVLNKGQKTLIELKHLQRRLHEDQLILAKQKRLPKARLDNFESNLQTLLKQSAGLPEKSRSNFNKNIINVIKDYRNLLAEAKMKTQNTKDREEIGKMLKRNIEETERNISSLNDKRKAEFDILREQLQTVSSTNE